MRKRRFDLLPRHAGSQHNKRLAQINQWSRRARKKSAVAASADIRISQKLLPIGIQNGSSGYP